MKARPVTPRSSAITEKDFQEGVLYRCVRSNGNPALIGCYAWREGDYIKSYRPKTKDMDYGVGMYFGRRYFFVAMPKCSVLIFHNENGDLVNKVF